ncbi:ketose-bisphosphate aldolase class-II family protein [Melia azedarach]|uniref:Ketose-bisphosphate aldolase class-II family protein n=1 Tax=Melia azedarach TaxID=155640 RepID=A0ACC1YH39_MELAZ|nr:ketose-bisphosphate aldolase class-II family protein [Melia azedarach]
MLLFQVELPPQTSKALEAKHAQVVGQALAGVPLWEPGLESRHPGVPYIVFPGNVGDNNTLAQAVILSSRRNLLLVGIVSKILLLVSFSDTDNMIRIKHVEKGEYAVGAYFQCL